MPDTALPTTPPTPAKAAKPVLLDKAGATALLASYGKPRELTVKKDIGRIDQHMAKFISLAPLCLVSTADKSGKQDVGPRGDPPGAFKVLDEHTIAFADRPGNNRLDTLTNLVENPEIALLFLLPGIGETVRVAGTASLSVDPELLAAMAVQGKPPLCAIVVHVRQAYLHCAKALLRSKFWSGEYAVAKDAFPSIVRMIADQVGMGGADIEANEKRVEKNYRDGLWSHTT